MADISTTNLDAGTDSPAAARVELLAVTQRLNALTRTAPASGEGAAMLPVRDAGALYTAADAEAAFAEVGGYLRKRCNPLMHPWGAKFDGATDDTAALNACIEYARANNLAVELPPGTAIVSNLLFGTQATGAQSGAPPAMIGAGPAATTLKAKAGTTGTLLKAWSIAGVFWAGFTVDCSNISGLVGIDTTWHPGVGPSLQCKFTGVWVQNYAATGWTADNNNDVTFEKVLIRTPVTTTQVALRCRASGGLVILRDCTWASGLLDVSAQNVHIMTSWGHGIRFAAGGTNIVSLDGCYLYGSPVTGAIIATEGTASGTKIQALQATGCWIDCTTGQSVFNGRFGSGITLDACAFSPTGTTTSVQLLGAGCTRDLGNGRVLVELNNCRAEYNPNASPAGALVIDFVDRTGFSIIRRRYDKTGTQVNDAGLVIKYVTTLGAVTAGSWYPLTGGNELEPGLWALSVLWDSTAVGAPYYVGATAMVQTLPTNGASAGAALPGVNCDSHAHSGATIAIRPAANTTGLASDFDWQPSVGLASGSTLTVRAVKLA